MNEESLAELTGIILGDGCVKIGSRSIFSIWGELKNERIYFENVVIPLVNSVGICIYKNFKPVDLCIFRKKNACAIIINKKKIIKMFAEILKIKNTPKIKKIPNWIMNSDENIIKSFLRGIGDTDGSIFFRRSYNKNASRFQKKYHHKPRFRISSVNKELIDGIILLSNKIGMTPWAQKPYQGRRDKKINYYVVFDKKKDILRWFEDIKLKNIKHVSKFKIWQKLRFCPPHLTLEEKNKILKDNLSITDIKAGVAKSGQRVLIT